MRYPQSTSKIRKLLEELGVPAPSINAVALVANPDIPGNSSYGWYLKKPEAEIVNIFEKLQIILHLKNYWRCIKNGSCAAAEFILDTFIRKPLFKALG